MVQSLRAGLVSLCLLTGKVAEGQCAARVISDAEISTAVSFGPTPGSRLWCGNLLKIPAAGQEKPQTSVLTCGDACCGYAKLNDGRNVRAVERAELRGWITEPSAPDQAEGELHFLLIPDFGWTPRSPGVRPMNRLEELMKVLTPMGDTELGGIKVELNLWGPMRICGISAGWCGAECADGNLNTAASVYFQRGRFCDEFQTRRPTDWCFPTSVANIFAPFDLSDPPHHSSTSRGRFQAGDYVRVVGTLWEDGAHGANCWKAPGSHSAERGWLELHSVDFMARVPPEARGQVNTSPDGLRPTEIATLGVCLPSSVGGATEVKRIDVFPATAKPPGHWRAAAREVRSADFTNEGTATTVLSKTADRVKVQATVTAPPGLTARGLFFAAYTGYWERCTASCGGKCGGAYDGCDGACTGGCGLGSDCVEQRCVRQECPGGAPLCRGKCCGVDEVCRMRGCSPRAPDDR
jgi:hypothetical protein